MKCKIGRFRGRRLETWGTDGFKFFLSLLVCFHEMLWTDSEKKVSNEHRTDNGENGSIDGPNSIPEEKEISSLRHTEYLPQDFLAFSNSYVSHQPQSNVQPYRSTSGHRKKI